MSIAPRLNYVRLHPALDHSEFDRATRIRERHYPELKRTGLSTPQAATSEQRESDKQNRDIAQAATHLTSFSQVAARL
jgi:hypothetical protein